MILQNESNANGKASHYITLLQITNGVYNFFSFSLSTVTLFYTLFFEHTVDLNTVEKEGSIQIRSDQSIQNWNFLLTITMRNAVDDCICFLHYISIKMNLFLMNFLCFSWWHIKGKRIASILSKHSKNFILVFAMFVCVFATMANEKNKSNIPVWVDGLTKSEPSCQSTISNISNNSNHVSLWISLHVLAWICFWFDKKTFFGA